MKSNNSLTDFYQQNTVDTTAIAKLFKKIKKKKPKDLDQVVHQLHEEAFENTACLDCANCCKTTGPLFIDKDIQRISKVLGLTEKEFEKQYLRKDEDLDLVLNNLPCPFLESDNKCGIYDFRPRACATFPHTDRSKQYQILTLTEKNALVCPAVFKIVERLKQHYR